MGLTPLHDDCIPLASVNEQPLRFSGPGVNAGYLGHGELVTLHEDGCAAEDRRVARCSVGASRCRISCTGLR